MDELERLKGRMNEKLNQDKKERSGPARSAPVDDLEAAKMANPGKTIYAISCVIQCPWAKCGQIFPVGLFVTFEDGQTFHHYCPRCRENIVTLRDTIRIYGQNTYPIERVQKAMRDNPGKYDAWVNRLKAAYDVATDIRDKVWNQAKVRESVLMEGENGERDTKIEMTVEDPKEAIHDMNIIRDTASVRDPLSTMTRSQMAEFFIDPDVEAKFGVKK